VPTEAPTGEPPTEAPTDLPTVAPSFESTTPPDVPTATCRNDTIGITVTYRADWFASTDASTQCLGIDRNPVESAAAAGKAAIAIIKLPAAFDTVLAIYRDPAKYEILDELDTLKVDGLAATALYVKNKGNGSDFSAGVEEVLVFVNRTAGETLLLGTAGVDPSTFTENQSVLGEIVSALKIDQ
jgi:hypothetical protein